MITTLLPQHAVPKLDGVIRKEKLNYSFHRAPSKDSALQRFFQLIRMIIFVSNYTNNSFLVAARTSTLILSTFSPYVFYKFSNGFFHLISLHLGRILIETVSSRAHGEFHIHLAWDPVVRGFLSCFMKTNFIFSLVPSLCLLRRPFQSELALQNVDT